MTERPDPPVSRAKRRRKATPPGHIEVAPASVGQGAQVEAATNATGAAKRRAPRKRAGKNGREVADIAPSTVIDAPGAEVSAGDASAAERSVGEHAVVEVAVASAAHPEGAPGSEGDGRAIAVSAPPAKSNGRAAARRPKAKPSASNGAANRAQPSIPAEAPAADTIAVVATPAMDALATDSIMAPAVVATPDSAAGDASPAPQAAAQETPREADDSGESDRPEDAATGASEPPSAPETPESDDAVVRISDGPPPDEPPHHHGWVYLALGVFALALLFGAWGVWTVFFAGGEDDARDAASLVKRNESLRQEVATLRRSDQISREANRDLQRALAERDEEISGLRADVAFYERFVGATGQRRGLSVHDMELQLQSEGTWHFVATLTQNLNRGAVNTGRLTVSVEGTRNDRLERLSWTRLRKQNNAPGAPYSFKYFQQVEGDLFLPADFKPVRVTVRLVPSGGAAVEQSFAWADTLDRSPVP